MSAPLKLAVSVDQLYPEAAVFMARTDLYQTRMLGYTELQLDTVTTVCVGLFGGRAAIRHEAGCSPEALKLFELAGIDMSEQTAVYRTPEQARQLANDFIAQGKRLLWPYPPPENEFPLSAHLVPPHLYYQLNAKENLTSIVPSEHLPDRKILGHDELAGLDLSEPLFLKAAGNAPTGWGYAVHACRDSDSLDAARRWFHTHRADIPAIIVEQAVAVRHCWCVGIGVTDHSVVCFGGAEQLFESEGKQSGTMIDPKVPLPAAGHTLAKKIGDTARGLGFRGIAGLDIGEDESGRLVVFDPNFRINSSTVQLLLHDAAARRTGLDVSRSFQMSLGGSFKEISAQLRAPIEEGWFVPTRLFNGERHPRADGEHIITGFVMGDDRQGATQNGSRLERLLESV